MRTNFRRYDRHATKRNLDVNGSVEIKRRQIIPSEIGTRKLDSCAYRLKCVLSVLTEASCRIFRSRVFDHFHRPVNPDRTQRVGADATTQMLPRPLCRRRRHRRRQCFVPVHC